MVILFKKKKISFSTSILEWNLHDKLHSHFVAFAALFSPAFLDLLKQERYKH